jgi:hypothetical protein
MPAKREAGAAVMNTKVRMAVACAAVVACVFGMCSTAVAGPGGCRRTGYNAKSFHLIPAGKSASSTEVKFYNYDFGTPTCARADNVEWPVDLLFFNNATIDKINTTLGSFFPYGKPFASTDYARINDGAGYFWARNGGRKTAAESAGTSDDHYRIYAYSQRSYTTSLGYFVIGTMHKDFNEFAGATEATYGDSEQAEHDLWADASSLTGAGEVEEVDYDNYDMRNEQ